MKRIEIIKNYKDAHINLLIGEQHDVTEKKAEELLRLKVAKLMYKQNGQNIETTSVTNFETR